MIKRRFLPVGQGAFYCEQFFDFIDGETINVVYDCGTLTKGTHLETQIKRVFKKDEIIHAVFISHLDEDHINGLPILLDHCKVKKIFFPLITEEDANIMTLLDLISGRGHSSFVASFLVNPRNAINDLGLDYETELYQIRGENTDAPRDNNQETLPSGESVSPIVLRGLSLKGTKMEDWLFVPVNFRQQSRFFQLQAELVAVFGRELNNEDILDLWENGSDADRDDIKAAYHKVKGSMNTNSMTLYSGTKELVYGQSLIFKICGCMCRFDDKPVGGLYTGDYEASGICKWRDLTNAYTNYWENIGCVQIPHHGSKYNYNPEFAKMNAYFVMSAGTKNVHKHPHIAVLKDLIYNGHFPFVVTENPGSEVELEINI